MSIVTIVTVLCLASPPGMLGNLVTIAGSKCDIAAESATQITCYTNHHNGAVEAPVIVEVPGQGYARHSDLAPSTFYYIDRWSSIWTWGDQIMLIGGAYSPMKTETVSIDEGLHHPSFDLIHSTR